VYGFIAVLAVGTSLLFGLAPALHATRQRGAEVLKEGGRGGQGSGPRRLTGALVIVQLSLAVILLTSAGVMIRSTRNVHTVEWPVDPDAVVTMGITLPVADYPEREQIVAFHDELRRRVTALPGVDGYAIASTVPGQGGYTVLAGIESREAEGDEAGELLQQVIVGPGYFDLVDTRPLRGRLFMDADVYEGEMVVVVEQRLADRFWPGEDAVGKRFRWLDQEERRWLTVVGVVPDIKQTVSLGFTGDYPVVYTPYRQEPLRNTGMLVRSASPAEAVAALLRDEVERLDANLPLYDVAILRSVVNERMIGFRIVSVLFFLLGGIALFLSCIGIYAVMAFAVGRRQREIGIRVALGAQRREVLTLVVRRAAFQTTVGLVLGLLAALATTRLLGMYLYEVSPNDPATFVLTVMVLLATAVAASLVPARRAGRVDPLAALRSQ
jgi:predicted permease